MGRAELVKSSIHGMLLYSFYIYAWPKGLLRSLDTKIRNFLWTGDVAKQKLVTAKWSIIGQPVKNGGIGIRPIGLLNKAAMLHLAWTCSHLLNIGRLIPVIGSCGVNSILHLLFGRELNSGSPWFMIT